ncbi:MAG: 16S rRNA (uracil(1498)-N(3))-methyltransferase [Acidimicrobiales bacterium]|nr:16S rRNA (uracil(1498)-N(3))-methyltransferase [Acidimicrobiales bacterium]
MIVADVEHPELDADDRHHLERVRRVRDGDPVSVTDGAGRWRWCRFGSLLAVDGEVVADPVPQPSLAVAFALVKGARPDLVVQKLTELGVDRIVPFVADRSVVRWDDAKGARQAERLARIAREAAMQSRRTWLAEVEPVTTFDEVIARPDAVAADPGGPPPRPGSALVLVGPEGGWSPEERSRLPARVGFAPTVLRAETAAIAAGAVFAALREGLVAGTGEP